METYRECYELNRKKGLIVILVGKSAESLLPVFDLRHHDIRDYEPYFYRDDPVNWRIL